MGVDKHLLYLILPEKGSNFFAFVQMNFFCADLLVSLMAFSRQKEHISRPAHGQELPDGRPAVCLAVVGGEAGGKARLHLIQDGLRVLGAGIVGGEEEEVRQLCRDLPHDGALAPVPVPSAAEEAQEPAGGAPPWRW